MTDHDLEIIKAMVQYGGSFVKHLGEAARFADADNLQRLKTAFPEYWAKYGQIVDSVAQMWPSAMYSRRNE